MEIIVESVIEHCLEPRFQWEADRRAKSERPTGQDDSTLKRVW